ncbi:hypothetical protein AB6C88_17295 [Vibrio splendidus]
MNQNEVIEYITENACFPGKMKAKVLSFLQYMESEQDDHYYPLTKIKKISGLDTFRSMDLARFFCSARVSMLEPKYVYITYDDDVVEISKTDFNTGLKISSESLKTEDGILIENFNSKRLKFYFIRKTEVRYEEYEW